MVAQIHRCLVFLILSEISETSNTLKLPENSVTIDPDTKLILFGSGNGNRLPSKFLDDGTNRMWGYEGTNELTQVFFGFLKYFIISFRQYYVDSLEIDRQIEQYCNTLCPIYKFLSWLRRISKNIYFEVW